MSTALLSVLSAADVYEGLGRKGSISGLAHFGALTRTTAPLHILQCEPGGYGGLRDALVEAPQNCALLIDAPEMENFAIWGGTSSQIAIARGIQTVILNTCIRDANEIGQMPISIYCTGTRLEAASKQGVTRSVQDVLFVGVRVSAGDIMVADLDGVVVVPRQEAEAAALGAYAIRTRNEEILLRAMPKT
jgi:4-hydroxy-4-methyl-2-oxoglutarate aldolase